MKRKHITILLLSLVALTGLICTIFFIGGKTYRSGESDEFELSIGEIVSIKLPENSSTGYETCWINTSKCRRVVLISQDYSSSIFERFGGIGAGGSVTLTFEAISPGIDTVKLSQCPTLRMQKDCSFFDGDSSRLQDGDAIISTYDPNRTSDYVFVFKVGN